RYFANFSTEPYSYGADFGGRLLVRKGGHGTLIFDNRLPSRSVEQAHVDAKEKVTWYDGQSPSTGPRQLALHDALIKAAGSPRVHDHPADALGPQIIRTVAQMRRQKDTDEVDLLRRCMVAGKTGHDWAKANVQPGMTELDVFNGVLAAVN